MKRAPVVRLVIVAKEPRAGQVKTRLGARIGPTPAAELAQAFLEDTLLRMRGLADQLWLCHAPAEISQGFRERCQAISPELRFVSQVDGDLGARLAAALAGEGVRLAIGCDAPDLPLACVRQAIAALGAEFDAVAAPARDGGYTLLGLGPVVDSAPLAGPIRWSHAETWADTRAAFAPAPVGEVTPWDDVDELEDLIALCARLDPAACPATAAWARANAYLDR